MYFPAAGVEVAPWIPPVVSFAISFLTSMGGVSGAFLLLPFQMSFLDYTNPSVSATNQLFNIVAIPSGVYRYYKEGRMVWPLTWVVVIGTLPGVLIGAFVRVTWLPDPKQFKLFAAAVLLYIGIRMLRDLVRKKTGDGMPGKGAGENRFAELVRTHQQNQERMPAITITHFNHRRLGYSFYGEQFDVPLWTVLWLSFLVGIVGGIYGIGGGAIMSPFFVSILELPVYTVAGAALMGTFVTSVAGVVFYQSIAPFYPKLSVAPDLQLGVLFGLGGMAGMYLGARCQKHVPAKVIKWLLCTILMYTAIKYALDFFR